jgi:hypothetical protein
MSELLTKREEIATRLAVGLLSNYMVDESGKTMGVKEKCLHAVKCADAMIERLGVSK